MNNSNRRKFSDLSTTKYNFTKTVTNPEHKTENAAVDNFLSTMIFNLKPKIKRSFQTQTHSRSGVKSRSFSHNDHQRKGENMRETRMNNIQNQQIDISLPKPILVPIKQSKAGKSKRNKFKTIGDIISPKNLKNSYKLKTLGTLKANTTCKNASIKRNQTISSDKQSQRLTNFEQKNHFMKIQQYSSYFNEQTLYRRLCIYSKQAIKNSIRIYRQDLQKLIIHRYGKDRITTFLDTQYIQDYDSVLKTIKNILKFNAEEILVLVFLIMDQNCDGLITPEDLVNFIGAKNEKVLTNPLLMQDLHEIIVYLKQKSQNGTQLNDIASEEYELLSEESITLMKFRIFKFQKLKKKRDKEGGMRRKKLMIGNIHQMLFTFRQQQNDFKFLSKKKINKNISCLISFIMKTNKKQKNSQQVKPLDFSINFESFKQIFANKIPKTFIDFLFLYGGIQSPKISYIALDGSVLIKPVQVKAEVQQEKGLDKIKNMIEDMRQFTRESSRIYNSLLNE